MNPLELRVGVLPHVRAAVSLGKSLSLGSQISYLERVALGEALEKHWDTPALFCGYYIDGEERLPRLAKKDERWLRSRGRNVYVHTLAVDYDLPKDRGAKRPWSSLDEANDFLAHLAEVDAPWPTAFYSTKHGARLAYCLQRAISPHEAEEAYSRLLDRLRAVGISGDENTSDWTRFFALPFVTKQEVDPQTGLVLAEEPLWENPTIFVELFEDHLLDPAPLIAQSKHFEPCVISDDRPDVQACDRLLWRDNNQTTAHKLAKKLLEKNSFGAHLFDGHSCDFAPGQRDSRLNAMAWSVVRSIFGRKGLEEAGPELAYAIMRGGVSQMEPDADEPDKDWLEVLWEKTCRIWEQISDEEELEQLSDEEMEQKVLAGWKDQLRRDGGPTLKDIMARSKIDREIDMMKRALILVSRSEHFLLDETGNYRPRATGVSAIHGAVEMMGLGKLYGLERYGDRVTESELKRAHGIYVDEVVGRLGQEKGQISGLGTDCVRLYIPTYYLVDIDPLWVQEVDDWLQVFAGDSYERLVDWIAHAQVVDRPVCSLSLTGGPGAGKSFFAELLGARFGPGGKNNEHVFGQWNFRLRDNPVVHIDEGLSSLKGAKDIDARFRELVTGGNLVLSQRNVDERTYEVYPRIVIAANNLEALHHIVANRDLDDDSHYALAERILHMQVDDAAKKLVTRDRTENWIRGEQLALRHFAWIHAHRAESPWKGGGRFLVEGDRHSEMLQETRFCSPLVEAVQRVLIKVVEAGNSAGAGVELQGDSVLASASRVSEIMGHQNHEFYHLAKSPRAVGMALKKLSNGVGTRHPSRMWVVPVENLVRYALEMGARCDRLTEAYVEKFGEHRLQTLRSALH